MSGKEALQRWKEVEEEGVKVEEGVEKEDVGGGGREGGGVEEGGVGS